MATSTKTTVITDMDTVSVINMKGALTNGDRSFKVL